MSDLPPPDARVAIVEDEAIVALDIRQHLERMGLTVAHSFSRGKDALDWLASVAYPPDLFIMDVRLEGELSGIETAGKIIHSYLIPVVILAAFTDSNTTSAALDVSPYGYIVKPFDERELRTGITIALLRHRVETEISQGRALFSAAIESLPDGILITNTDDIIVAGNSLLRNMFGVAESQLNGFYLREFLQRYNLVPDGTSRFLQAVYPCRVEVTAAELTQDPYGRLVIFRDVTSQYEAEQRLAEAQRQLRHSAKMEALGRMSEGVAHDFNNMLAGIAGHMAVLRQHWQEQKNLGNESPKVDDSIAGVTAATRKSSELICHLMTFSRSQQMHFQTFGLDAVMAQTVGVLQSLLRDGLQVEYVPAAGTARVCADKPSWNRW